LELLVVEQICTTMNSNQNLFFYGLGANAIKIVGAIIMGWGVFGFFFHHVIGIIIFSFGTLIYFKGRAMRFDYQRQSGSIIHKGDWN
jgi:hypothetical protein